MSNPYADIIRLARPRSAEHPPMPPHSRAAQFAPFAALTGFDGVIEESDRRTQEALYFADAHPAPWDDGWQLGCDSI